MTPESFNCRSHTVTKFIFVAKRFGKSFANSKSNMEIKDNELCSELKIINNKQVLNKEETSKFLGVSTRHIDNLINSRSIPFSRVGGRIVFQRKRLDAYLNSSDSLGGIAI